VHHPAGHNQNERHKRNYKTAKITQKEKRPCTKHGSHQLKSCTRIVGATVLGRLLSLAVLRKFRLPTSHAGERGRSPLQSDCGICIKSIIPSKVIYYLHPQLADFGV